MTASTEAPRVLMVVRLFHPWIGGAERQALKLSRALRNVGVDVEILTGRWFAGTARQESAGGVPVTRHGALGSLRAVRGMGTAGGYVYMMTLAWHLWRRRNRIDLIHVHGLNYHAAVATSVGHALGKPVVTKLANSGQASDIRKMREDRQLRGARFMVKPALRADRFVALNDAIVDELIAAGVPPDRIVGIPNGVDLPPTHPAVNETPPFTALYAGRLHEQKNVGALVQAMRRVDESRPGSVRLRVVGDGPARDGLVALAEGLGLADVVNFVGPVDDVAPELRAADLFVLPSRDEGLSNALLEAMAAGVPVIASDIPGNVELVAHRHTGLLFPVDDICALASAIGELAGDAALRSQLGSAGRACVIARFGIDEVAQRYLELYRELVACRTRTVGARDYGPVSVREVVR